MEIRGGKQIVAPAPVRLTASARSQDGRLLEAGHCGGGMAFDGWSHRHGIKTPSFQCRGFYRSPRLRARFSFVTGGKPRRGPVPAPGALEPRLAAVDKAPFGTVRACLPPRLLLLSWPWTGPGILLHSLGNNPCKNHENPINRPVTMNGIGADLAYKRRNLLHSAFSIVLRGVHAAILPNARFFGQGNSVI